MNEEVGEDATALLEVAAATDDLVSSVTVVDELLDVASTAPFVFSGVDDGWAFCSVEVAAATVGCAGC